ncbi:helix-turn-helix domain-containing protein [Flavobacterium sp. XGLA_31]|uniref:helix-turn-helix domain-containing protein n=1 Tax=Flavobacterium sp. XGLA_31 TaxID=3447666 RepID=UPI003F37C0B3
MHPNQYIRNCKIILIVWSSFTHLNTVAQTPPPAETLIQEAKAAKDYRKMANTYKALLYRADKSKCFRYADSMLTCAEKTKDPATIGAAYLTKGTLYYNRKDNKKALDNFILADRYIAATGDTYLKYKTKYTIAQIKNYLGFYDEAIALFRECAGYFEEENDLAYLTALHSLGLCYNKIGQYDKCSYYNALGIQKGMEFKNREMEPYFRHSEGINRFFRKKYALAIRELSAVLPLIRQKKDFANETVALFYLGKSHAALGQKPEAVAYFIKVDKAFTTHQYIRPDVRENYELLINYYKKQNNPQQQLYYINRLLKVDSLLNQNYRYLSQRMYKEYDTKKLIAAKNDIEQAMTAGNRLHYTIILSLLGAVTTLGFRHVRNKKRYKQKFDSLMERSQNSTKVEPANHKVTHIEINPNLEAAILQNLIKFEKNKKYLEKDMTLSRLAAHLKTNSKYASKIVLKHRGKKSIEYISDLKIAHIVELLKTENKYRNYTYKALAEEVGFGSTQNFTRVFKAQTGISPSYFIQQINKTITTGK